MKKLNTKTTKRVAAIILAAFAACSIMGCSVKSSFTTTETHTFTDADGNSTTTTTTNDNGKITTETHTSSASEANSSEDVEETDTQAPQVFSQVPVAIVNNMGFDIAELNIKMSVDEAWSDNFVGEGSYVMDGTVANGITITFDEENKFIDIHVADANGEGMEFNGVELPTEFNEEIALTFEYDEAAGSYTVYAGN
ncbi:MAG: hypothetical protein MJZ11_09850 [Lachnospiraceae bacterium]|nr:hypothetical protein [Lachnospiraceae bacterium]